MTVNFPVNRIVVKRQSLASYPHKDKFKAWEHNWHLEIIDREKKRFLKY